MEGLGVWSFGRRSLHWGSLAALSGGAIARGRGLVLAHGFFRKTPRLSKPDGSTYRARSSPSMSSRRHVPLRARWHTNSIAPSIDHKRVPFCRNVRPRGVVADLGDAIQGD